MASGFKNLCVQVGKKIEDNLNNKGSPFKFKKLCIVYVFTCFFCQQ